MDQAPLNFKVFLEKSFRTLRSQKISHLVLDLRNNKGGELQLVSILLSYLIPKSFQVHKEISRHPLHSQEQNAPTTLALFLGKAHIQPQAQVFNGKILVITNGMTFSGAADVASILHANRSSPDDVFFVGEETGGAYQGSCSGILPAFSLTYSRIKLRIPLWKFQNQVEAQLFQHRGLLPDYPLSQNPSDFRTGIDTEMRFAFTYFGEYTAGI
ncbi:MAG: S41 family peptidase [Bacteroidota bacterium]